MQLERHHATLFVGGPVAPLVEERRRRWDPAMAARIAAHVTLVYPWEADDPAAIEGWVRAAVVGQAPFRCRVGPLRRFESDEGVGCAHLVEDVECGIAALRDRLPRPAFRPGDVEPHLTIVHPRTSRAGDEAYASLASSPLGLGAEFDPDLGLRFDAVAITAWDGDRWATVASFPLTG